jgi:PKD repeat protein
VLTSFNWNFGDAASPSDQSTQQNPTHYFTAGAGSYHVKLYVTNNYGCSDTVYKYVKVHDNPKAGFTYIQQNNPMTTVNFTDTSHMSRERTPINSYLWSFYNGDVSDSANPSYNFPGDGQCYPVTLTVTDTNGCSNTDTTDVCLLPPPPLDFTMTQDSICLGEKITFSGQASNIVSWHWDFGNGDTAAYQNPLPYTYLLPGTYNVTLTVTDVHGFSNSVTHKVFVSDNPKADFSFGRACLSDSVDFLNETTTHSGVLTTFEWNFGDPASASNQSTEQNPAHSFSNGAGSYHVKLYVANNYGCSDSVYKYVKVHDKPKAGFTYTQLGNMTSVSFTDTSQMSHDRSPITSYLWSFYNGDISDSVNPTYNFPNDGQCYPVTLKVTDTNECSSTDTVDVCLLAPPSLSFTKTEVCMGNRTHFEASYSSSIDTTGYYFRWDFGDGSTVVYTYQDTISHRFNQPGTFDVQLTAVGTNGNKVSVSHNTVVDSLPDADFTFVTPGCDQATTFEAPTWGGGSPIKTWSWNFGDTASEQDNVSDYWNPSHLYPSEDSTYYVSLRVVNANGCVSSARKPVVRSSCASISYAVVNPACSSNPVYFKDQTSLNSTLGKITQWEWDFGDSTIKTYSSFQDSVSHVYKTAGRYKVTLTEHAIVNNMPSVGTYDSVIVINQSPQANFGFTSACISNTVYFKDSSWSNNSRINKYQWDFDDPFSSDDKSNVESPAHTYKTAGSFPAQLVVIDNLNCRDTATKHVEVHNPPIASFKIISNYNGTRGQLYFDNSSIGAVSYLWEFGDGNTSVDKDPVYQYFSSGLFNVLLIATNKYSCSDTASYAYDLTSGLYVPNSFDPGSSNPKINKFEPVGIHLKKYEIQVYSAWGILLWESTKLDANGSPTEGWDGTYKGQPMPPGDYIWRVSAEFLNGKAWQGSDNGDGNKKPYGRVLLIR